MDNQDQIIEELLKLNNALIEQIAALQKDNIDSKNRISYLESYMSEMLSGQKSIVQTITSNQHEVKILADTMARSINNIPYELGFGEIPYPNVDTATNTVEKILLDKSSICRFGDGEFSIMAGHSRQRFQKQNDLLAARLIEVINSNDPNCLIAIADNYGSLNKYCDMSKNEIRFYMTEEVRKSHAKFLDINRTYYNAYISTPYLMYNDKETSGPTIRFNKLRNIWDNRDVIIVEGCLSRLGVGNDLFNNCNSIRRILCPAEHAFDCYDDILYKSIQIAESIASDSTLFIISLGPTATVLAYDLFKNGFQALDFGHVDNDYEFYLNHATERYAIPGKYVNNITQISDVEPVSDKDYSSQIVAEIY